MSILIPSLLFSLAREDSSRPGPILEVKKPCKIVLGYGEELVPNCMLSRKRLDQF